MPFSAFYDPARVGASYVPRISQAITAGQAANFAAADEDTLRTILLLVDAQVDFVHIDGSLSVPGAVEDTRRTIQWLLHNTPRITTIAASLDSHTPMQIFYPTWWVNINGRHPEAYTTISSADIEANTWLPTQEPEWSVEYVRKLEAQAKKVLMIWPYHTMIGTPGHALTPALYEAVAYHSAARHNQPIFLAKGALAKTEHYSIVEPEVKVPGHPQGDLNTHFLDMLATYDRIYIAGQAKSHCVLETIKSIINYFVDQPAVIERLHLLTDCTSSVAHPEIDFDALADKALAEFAQQGLKLVTSTEALA